MKKQAVSIRALRSRLVKLEEEIAELRKSNRALKAAEAKHRSDKILLNAALRDMCSKLEKATA